MAEDENNSPQQNPADDAPKALSNQSTDNQYAVEVEKIKLSAIGLGATLNISNHLDVISKLRKEHDRSEENLLEMFMQVGQVSGGMVGLMETIKIFCCYARKDGELQDQLVKHLEPLRRSGQVTTWYDRKLLPGTDWKQEIDKHLNTSDIVLLLISPNFMSSDYSYSIEMQRALVRHERGEARVIPVILRPVNWKETPIGKLQALPTDGKPIVRWNDRDEAFQDVVRGITTVVSSLRKAREEAFLSLDAQKAQVSVEIDGEITTTYSLNKRSITIGRSTNADIFILSPYITVHHAVIRWIDRAWVIIDTGHPNGLYYNKQHIHQHTFTDGDRVYVGNVAIHFQLIP